MIEVRRHSDAKVSLFPEYLLSAEVYGHLDPRRDERIEAYGCT